jgi:beta-glucosidase
MKKAFFIVFIGFFFLAGPVYAHPAGAYLNPSLPVNVRVNDLISLRVLKEKVFQMLNTTPAVPRRHNSAYNWRGEALHGVARSGGATGLQQSMGPGVAVDSSLVKKIGKTNFDGSRAMHNPAVSRENHLQYGEMTFWGPNNNIFRDIRWRRGEQTYEEDSDLFSQMAVAFISSVQVEKPKCQKVSACAMDFAAYSGPERLRHEFQAKVSMDDLYASYLPAFRAAIKAAFNGIMCACNVIDGPPCCADTWLSDRLQNRERVSRDHTISDCVTVGGIYQGRRLESNMLDPSAVVLKGRVKLICGNAYLNLTEALQRGLIKKKDLDSSPAVLLPIRCGLGMFNPEVDNLHNAIPYRPGNSPRHRALTKRTAAEPIVILKNGGVLPLKIISRGILISSGRIQTGRFFSYPRNGSGSE